MFGFQLVGHSLQHAIDHKYYVCNWFHLYDDIGLYIIYYVCKAYAAKGKIILGLQRVVFCELLSSRIFFKDNAIFFNNLFHGIWSHALQQCIFFEKQKDEDGDANKTKNSRVCQNL